MRVRVMELISVLRCLRRPMAVETSKGNASEEGPYDAQVSVLDASQQTREQTSACGHVSRAGARVGWVVRRRGVKLAATDGGSRYELSL